MDNSSRIHDLTSLLTHKNLVKCGARHVAEFSVCNENVEEARKLIESRDPPGREKIFYLEYPWEENHTNFYIFKHPHLKHIIESLQAHSREWNLDFAIWVNGHLFGYGEKEIGQHIERNSKGA